MSRRPLAIALAAVITSALLPMAAAFWPILILMPIEHDPESPPDSRIAQLSGLGARVLVEGDRFGEGSIVVDLSCTAASEEDAADIALRQSLG